MSVTHVWGTAMNDQLFCGLALLPKRCVNIKAPHPVIVGRDKLAYTFKKYE